MFSSVYARHDGLPLYGTGLIWTTPQDLTEDAIREAEQITWEAAGSPPDSEVTS
jgi:hypothetical protein